MFDYYTKEKWPGSKLIDVIPKHKPDNKVQIHLESNQWMDVHDDDIGDRHEYVESLPINIRMALYEHTGKFIFHPKPKTTLIEKMQDDTFFSILMKKVKRIDITAGYLEEAHVERLSDVFDDMILSQAFSQAMFENDWYDYSYVIDEARNNPWDYIDEPPANLADAKHCELCNGTGFHLPFALSIDTYERIKDSYSPEIANKIMGSYEKDRDNMREWWKLKDDSDAIDLAKSINQKCPNCKGLGIEGGLKNPELYSEEQIEKAQNEAESRAADYQIKETMREYDRYASRDVPEKSINEVLSLIPNILAEMSKDWIIEHNIDTIINLNSYGFLDI